MTAPALHRYFTSREDLIRNVIGDIFNELSDDLRRAISQVHVPACGGITAKLIAACREFRRWSFSHQREFALIFGSPLPRVDDARGDFADECGRRFTGVFFALFYEVSQLCPFPVRAPEESTLRCARNSASCSVIGADLPLGALLAFLRCWTKLYGAVRMEVFGHIGFVLDDAAPMFEITLSELAEDVGLVYLPGT